jgi:ATP-dependent Clp protease protease subunit
MGTVLLTSGAPGKRFSLPHSTIHLHQVISGAQGQAKDIEIQARETLRLQRVIREILVKQTGQPMERVERDSDRDFWLDALAAKEYGLIDDIMQTPPGATAVTANGKAR